MVRRRGHADICILNKSRCLRPSAPKHIRVIVPTILSLRATTCCVNSPSPLRQLEYAYIGLSPSDRSPFGSVLRIGRVTADFERRQAAGQKLANPELSKTYAVLADRAVARGLEKSAHDPGLLVIKGLLAADFGTEDEERASLEEAFKGGAKQPVSYFVMLARLRFRHALEAALASSGGKLTAEQVGSVLEPLRAARLQRPVSAVVYGMAADLWTQTEAQPSPDDLAILEEGVRFFPFELPLVKATAVVFARMGKTEEAKRLIAHGLECAASNDPNHAAFEQLRLVIEGKTQPLPAR